MAYWSKGMSLALGVRGQGFKSLTSPFLNYQIGKLSFWLNIMSLRIVSVYMLELDVCVQTQWDFALCVTASRSACVVKVVKSNITPTPVGALCLLVLI